MFMIIVQLYLHMDSGSHLSTKKTRQDGMHVYKNMPTSVGVYTSMYTHAHSWK